MACKLPFPKEGRERGRKCPFGCYKWSMCQPKTEMADVLLYPLCGEMGVFLMLLFMALFLF